MLFTSSLLSTSWIKTRPAQKLLVRVKFTGNPYSYVCEWPPLKYMQTRVCRNSYTGTLTAPDLYSCLCERSLSHRNSVRLSITRVDQSKTVQARITTPSPMTAWKTLQGGPKNVPLYFCPYLCQKSTDFTIVLLLHSVDN